MQFSFLYIWQSFWLIYDASNLFCSCVDVVSPWQQIFNVFFLSPNCLYNFNSRIIGTHFAGIMTGKYREIIYETWRYIFRWCSSSPVSLRIGCLHGMIVCFSHFIGNYFSELKYILFFQAAKLNKVIVIMICLWWSTVKGPIELQQN